MTDRVRCAVSQPLLPQLQLYVGYLLAVVSSAVDTLPMPPHEVIHDHAPKGIPHQVDHGAHPVQQPVDGQDHCQICEGARGAQGRGIW